MTVTLPSDNILPSVCPIPTGTDDTLVLQAAFNSGNKIELAADEVYFVTNLSIPDITNFFLEGNGATIKKLTSGDNHYIIASIDYLNNAAFAQRPMTILNLKIDGDNIADNGLISQSWSSVVEIETSNNLNSGMVMTSNTRDGTALASSLVNNRVDIKSHHNGGYGFQVIDSARNKVTDGRLTGYLYSNGGYAAHLAAGAGWDIAINTYANGGGLLIDSGGQGTRIHDCYLDDGTGVSIPALPTGETHSYAFLLKNNIGLGLVPIINSHILGGVTSFGTGSAAPNGIMSINNAYSNRNGREGHIFHNFFDPLRHIVSVNDTFQTATPFRWHNASSTGKIKVNRSYSGATGDFITGSMNGTSVLSTFVDTSL